MWHKSSFTIPAVAGISFCLIGGTTPARADLGDQLFKLLPKDGGGKEDHFGWSVAISGNTVIVGADVGDDFNGTGSAYLFDITTGQQIAKLLANDGAADDQFGWSVAISGNTVIVGAHWDNDNGDRSGSAYLFDIRDPKNPVQIAKLLPDDGAEKEDYFGGSVAINGTTAIVGARGDDDNGSQSGSAYLFDATTGQQIVKFLPSDGAAGDQFGSSVAISGTTAIVGAQSDIDNGVESGSAYLFDISDPKNPSQIAKLLANDGAAEDHFGLSVAISGTTAIIGAWGDDDNGSFSGSAYLFDATSGQQLFKLLADDGEAGDGFGVSVAINGTTAIVGAHADDDNGFNSGSSYLFDTTTGHQIAKLLANDGAAVDTFGWSVAINGTTAIIGARYDDDNGFDSGSAYLFDASFCPWDLDGSGSVGASDLLSLLASWGPCKGCPADFDDNGSVGASDLLALLANWGLCP